MGGKQKQAQRTKGNVKPSSSGRSAALLGNTSLPGFPGLKDNVFPSFQSASSDDVDPNIDPNYQLVLKKMNKKDSITRIKALQEFSKLVESSTIDTLKPVLPLWPRLYCMLVGDVEHKVREAANDAQRIVVVQAKRNIAPYLRMLAGPWFIAQFDTYAPAASSAVRSFKEAFPAGKLIEAIVFCQDEILKFISDTLMDQAMIDIGNAEHNEKQDRNLIMCLQGYCHFLKIISGDMLSGSSFLKLSENLLQSEQFWKLADDKTPLVRSSWLAVLTLMLEKIPHLLVQHHQQIVNCVVGRLGDDDAIVLPYAWQTALNILIVLEDWSSYCNADLQIYPALWHTLKEGGYGCAGSIYQNMLPLLNSLLKIKKTREEKSTFVDLFFQSLREGFNKKSVQQSRSESEAVSQCYMECIRYVAKENILDSDLVTKHLIPVIEEMTLESKLNLISRGIFEHTSSLLHYWCSNEDVLKYDGLCQCFWNSLIDLYRRILAENGSGSQRTYILKQQMEFCQCLKDSKKIKSKSSQRVRFHLDNENSISEDNENKSNASATIACEKYMKYSQKLICSVSKFYLQKIKEEKDLNYVTPLCKLLIDFNDSNVFQDLVHSFNFSEIFGTILTDQSTSSFVETLVEFFFYIVQYLQASENEQILNILSEDLDILIWVLRFVKKQNFPLDVLQWLRAPHFSNKLIALSTRVWDPKDSSSAISVLMECISIASDGAFLVDISTISLILSELVKENDSMDRATLGAHFLITLEPLFTKRHVSLTKEQKEMLSSCIYKLVHLLFCLCCQQGNVSENDTSCLSMGWQNGINILTKIDITDIKTIISDMSSVVRKELLSRNLTLVEVENLLDLSVNFLNLLTSISEDVIQLYMEGILSQYKIMEKKLISLCESIEKLLGASIISNNIIEESSLQDSEIINYFILSVFISKVVVNMMSLERRKSNETVSNNSQGDFEPLNEEEKCLNIVEQTQAEELFNEHQIEILMHIALSVSMSNILERHFQSMSFHSTSQLYIPEIKKTFSGLLLLCTKNEKLCLINFAIKRAKQNGGMWIHAVYLFSDCDQLLTTYKCLLNSQSSDYSCKIFLEKAVESKIEVQFDHLGDTTNFLTIAYWLNYLYDVPVGTLAIEITSLISEWKNAGDKELLYDCDITEKPLNKIDEIVKKIKFLSVCLRKCPYLMKQDVWDFVIISAAYYAQNLKHCKKNYLNTMTSNTIFVISSFETEKTLKVCEFCIAVFDLLINIEEFCQYMKSEKHTDYNFDHVMEWKNVFADDVRVIVSNIFISLSENIKEPQLSLLGNVFLQKLCQVLKSLYEDCATSSDTAKSQKNKMLNACSKLIYSSVSALQITAHRILKSIIIQAVENDAELMNTESFEESNFNNTKLGIHPLLSALDETQSVVVIMLAEFFFGDSCIVQPHTDTYYYTAAYLFIWDILLTACENASSELRYQYASILRKEKYLCTLLNNIFHLMPAEIFETTVPKTQLTTLTSMFGEHPSVFIGMQCTSEVLQHWACWVYYCTVSRLPALVRQWWSDTKPKISSLVQKATVQYVTPLLCSRELQAIQNQNPKFKNMEVKVHSKAREVVAVYAIDEAQMELVITLPEEYPLATILVDSHSSSLVGTNQWRNWVKQLSIFLTHQNGSLWDGLLLWKSNLDKRFEGVEECYICFSILHGTNFQIPKLCCKTCKKKFHSPCLYKWFSTSNKSTCPICRNIF